MKSGIKKQLKVKEVIIEGEPSLLPRVLFRSFGESALQFELWCVVKDVNLKSIVQSDLNFAIDAAFREHNISIAFPQRDLHIKGLEGLRSLD